MNRPSRQPRLLPALIAGSVVLLLFAYVFESTSGVAPAPAAPEVEQLAEPVATTTTTTTTAPVAFRVPPGWTQLPAGPLEPRISHSSTWTGSELVVWGGRSLLHGRSSGATYSPTDGTWSELPNAPITGSARQTLTPSSGELLAFTAGAAVFDTGRQRWGELDWNNGTSTVVATAGSDTDVMIVTRDDGPGDTELAAFRYRPGEPCCDVLPSPPVRMSHGALFWTGADFLLVGGNDAPRAGDGPAGFARYDPATATWTVLDPPPLAVRGPLTAAWTGSRLVIIDYLMRTSMWVAGSGWTELPNAPFDYHGCIPRMAELGEERLFVWYCRQAAELDLDQGAAWTLLATPQLDPHAVSTSCLPATAGAKVLMWCGNEPGTPLFWEIDGASVVAAESWNRDS